MHLGNRDMLAILDNEVKVEYEVPRYIIYIFKQIFPEDLTCTFFKYCFSTVIHSLVMCVCVRVRARARVCVFVCVSVRDCVPA